MGCVAHQSLGCKRILSNEGLIVKIVGDRHNRKDQQQYAPQCTERKQELLAIRTRTTGEVP
jgi:hypothetical protein